MSGVTYESVRVLLQFTFHEAFTINAQNVEEVLQVFLEPINCKVRIEKRQLSVFYGIDLLREKCEDFIVECLPVKEHLSLLRKFDLPALEVCLYRNSIWLPESRREVVRSSSLVQSEMLFAGLSVGHIYKECGGRHC